MRCVAARPLWRQGVGRSRAPAGLLGRTGLHTPALSSTRGPGGCHQSSVVAVNIITQHRHGLLDSTQRILPNKARMMHPHCQHRRKATRHTQNNQGMTSTTACPAVSPSNCGHPPCAPVHLPLSLQLLRPALQCSAPAGGPAAAQLGCRPTAQRPVTVGQPHSQSHPATKPTHKHRDMHEQEGIRLLQQYEPVSCRCRLKSGNTMRGQRASIVNKIQPNRYMYVGHGRLRA